MDLAEKLISIPPRETDGGRSSNRYSYQQVWAFNFMLKMMSASEDFVLIMELHDDVLVLDSSISPTCIDFYQIKTDTKPSGYMTAATITRKLKKIKKSIVQKLISNYSKFRSETRSLHLVSNKSFDLGNLRNGASSISRSSIILSELDAVVMQKIKKSMCCECSCGGCLYAGGCHDACLPLLYFDVSELDIVNYEKSALGEFVKYLINISVDGRVNDAESIFNAILSEIKRINNCETIPSSKIELLQRKSITRANFNNYIQKLKDSISAEDMWNDVQQYLLHDGFSSIEVSKIAHHWKKLRLDSMDTDNLLLVEIREDIKALVATTTASNAKEYTEKVLPALTSRSYYSTYPKEYYIAMVARELYL